MRRVALYELMVFLGYLGTLLLLSVLVKAFAGHDQARVFIVFLFLISIPISLVVRCAVAFCVGETQGCTLIGMAGRILLALPVPVTALIAWFYIAFAIWGC
jgi:hypothetical protein